MIRTLNIAKTNLIAVTKYRENDYLMNKFALPISFSELFIDSDNCRKISFKSGIINNF